ncbi:helix-turn-helix transcriptional regulator [Chryseobacterium populi]|uniref:HTH luxR-type domain-containing protein n=1 Tax=Chryseobacterium populi TaxID=1144316 RepID=J2KLV1_9FLAO|nr:hypothetical protein [Chryseobacterium populi]EJL74038.1 hypothetical protein PMI13_01244 [Chryseobacterium populi]
MKPVKTIIAKTLFLVCLFGLVCKVYGSAPLITDLNIVSRSLSEEWESELKTFVKEYFEFENTAHQILQDTLKEIRDREPDLPVQQYMKDREEEYKDREFMFYYIICLIVFFSGFLLLIFAKINKRKEKLLEEKLEIKQEKIKEKEKEAQELKFKIHEGFEEIVKLAKENNPEFLTRFRDLYPRFCSELIKIYPDINNETLKFCALLKLNFSTKDISEYTFVTTRAVQMRKNRLRKKLNIHSHEDIYLWMNALG